MIYGPFNYIGIWRTRYNSELYKLCDEIDLVKVIKLGILRWLGHLFRMQELDPCRKAEGSCVGKPKLRWLESVEKDLKTWA
jgi:dissimilatory sulfite reductase (desulfoviridin) alpha/beta subunit